MSKQPNNNAFEYLPHCWGCCYYYYYYYYWFCSSSSSSNSSTSLCFEVTNFRFGVTMHNFKYLYARILKWTAFSMEWICDGGTVDVSCILTTVSKAQISETWAVQPPYLLPTSSLSATLLQAVSTHCLLWYSLFRWSHSTGRLCTSAIRASIADDMTRNAVAAADCSERTRWVAASCLSSRPAYVAPNWTERKRSESGLSVGGV